jgi:glycosyltransferase involved in cell wall biosynthesis
MRSRFLPFFSRIFYPGATGIVATSEEMADDLAEFVRIPRERIQVIYNPVVSPEIYSLAEEPLLHPWFEHGAPPVVLGVGRLTKAKDFPTLIRAFYLLRSRRPARLVILGEGEERAYIESKVRVLGIQGDVDLPGFTPNPFPYMRQAAVFVLSSAWEGLPNALIQALALGTPVISTDCRSGPREILNDGAFGKLVPVGDDAAMSSAIEEALRDGSCTVPETALDRFRRDTVAKAYLECILGGDYNG